MNERSIFLNISPLDHRYSLSESGLFNDLSEYLSEEAVVKSCIQVEIALIKSLLKEENKLSALLDAELDSVCAKILPQDIYAEEEKTKHNIRALVNVLKKHVPKNVAHLVHLGATSADILDTAFAWRIKNCVKKVILPLLKQLETLLCNLAIEYAQTPQVGRTHGQHAVPITFGFAMSLYVSRLGKSILEIERHTGNLCGKFSGAVGSYNAISLLVKKPEEFEKKFLSLLDLKPSENSTQIVEPEYMLRLLLETNAAFGIIANLADDLRNLQRSEIGEVYEYFSGDQVGSSTMPQKRNPWNSEHVKSLWKVFSPRVITFYADQISEHQRDLTNSASQRFIGEYLTGFAFAAERMRSIVSTLKPDAKKMMQTLANAGGAVQGGILAESAYILLAQTGLNDAHEHIRKMTLEAEKTQKSFFEILQNHTDLYDIINTQLKKIGIHDASSFFEHPETYNGIAAQKAREIGKKYGKIMEDV